jgi:hypothetical protein
MRRRPIEDGRLVAGHCDEPRDMASRDEVGCDRYRPDTANCKLGTGNRHRASPCSASSQVQVLRLTGEASRMGLLGTASHGRA